MTIIAPQAAARTFFPRYNAELCAKQSVAGLVVILALNLVRHHLTFNQVTLSLIQPNAHDFKCLA
jgi:hypothetical protein